VGAKTGFASKKKTNFDIRDRQVAPEDQFSSADHARQVLARFGLIISKKYTNSSQNESSLYRLDFFTLAWA
jgi:hypothetical protein